MTDNYKFVITGTDATQRAFKSIKANLTDVRGLVNSTQVKFAVFAGAAGMGAVVASSLQTVDALAKLSDQVDGTTEGIAGLQLITEISGGSTEQLGKALRFLRKSVGEADQGVGEAKEAFKALGIELDEIRDLTADEQFIVIADRIGNLADENLQAAAAADIFGRAGVELINVFEQGEPALRAAVEQAQDLGIAVSRLDAAKIEEANDTMLLLRRRLDGIGNQATIELAPIITEIASQFLDAAGSGEEFADVIEDGMRIGADVVGVFADGVHGVEVLLKGAEVAGRAFPVPFLAGLDLMTTGVFGFADTIKRGLLEPFRGWLMSAAEVPGVSDKATAALASLDTVLAREWRPPEGIRQTLDELTVGVATAKDELQQLMLQELPSAVIDAKLAEVLNLAEQRAAIIAENAQRRLDQTAASGTGAGEGAEDAKERQRLADRFLRLQESFMSEHELLRLKFEQEQQLLVESLTAKAITEQEFQQTQLQSVARFEEDKRKLETAGAKTRMNIVTGTLGQLAGAAAGSNKKLFKIQKAASLAQALVALPTAVIESFKNAGGYPWGLAPAAAMAATGAKQIAAIKSSNFSGGGASGSLPSIGGGGGAGNRGAQSLPAFGSGTGTENNQPTVIVQVNGDVISREEQQEFVITTVRDFTGNDGVIFSSDSAQGIELTT